MVHTGSWLLGCLLFFSHVCFPACFGIPQIRLAEIVILSRSHFHARHLTKRSSESLGRDTKELKDEWSDWMNDIEGETAQGISE